MEDTIYLAGEEGLVEMTEEAYEYERILQSTLADYPRLLGGGQMGDDGVYRWALVAREASVPDTEGGSGRWSADLLFVDQDGIPTIVEVKRGENTEVRREIVGQMLDYVAHASTHWSGEYLRELFEETCEANGLPVDEVLEELTGGEVPEDFWDGVERNLRTKKVRLIFAADRVPNELKRVVEFLNEAMHDTEVLAVEVIQYVSDHDSVFVPRLHGQTEEARGAKSSGRTGKEYVTTEDEMREDLQEKLSQGKISKEDHETFIDLYNFAQEIGDTVKIGGAKNANFRPFVKAHQGDHSGNPAVFTANVSNGVQIWPANMPLRNENPEEVIDWDPEAYDRFLTEFQSLDGVGPDANSTSLSVLTKGDNLDRFKKAVEAFVEHCRQAVKDK